MDKTTQQNVAARIDAADALSTKELMASLGRKALGNEPKAVRDESQQDDFRAGLLDFKDVALSNGDLVGMAGPIAPVNITARDMVYEPLMMSRLFEVHAPWKYQYSPYTITFDVNGNATFGVNVATSVLLNGLAAITPGFVGFVVRFKAADTLSGDSVVRMVKPSTGLDAEFSLSDITGEGVFTVLNHDLDDNKTVAMTLGAFNVPIQTFTFTETIVNVSNQQFFDYSSVADWALTGTNAIAYVYPLVITRELNMMIYAAIFSERLEDLPDMLADSFATQRAIAGNPMSR